MDNAQTKTLFILGRQPAIGVAEIESLYGSDSIIPFSKTVCLSTREASEIDFHRLGGSIRLGTIIADIQSSNWHTIEKNILQNSEDIFGQVDGKLSFGISAFDCSISAKQLAKTALLLKKTIKSSGQSVRMVPHNGTELNSATVLYNKLHRGNGFELLVVSNGERTILARTVAIQDIDAYSARDQARPMRDAKVGMLPPKLAQVIVNLATASLPPHDDTIILDAFCGTGVVLQEASLMGYGVAGTDIEPRMIEYSIANMQWLRDKFPDKTTYLRIEIGDAATHTWAPTPTVIAGETYLGQPLTSLPTGEHLSKIMYEVNLLHHKFLVNIADQISSGTRFCLAVPTWRGKHEFLHLPMLDHLTDIGYTRIRFNHVGNEDLIYHRENQVVGRELLVLEKR